jgi:hypothetical protein
MRLRPDFKLFTFDGKPVKLEGEDSTIGSLLIWITNIELVNPEENARHRFTASQKQSMYEMCHRLFTEKEVDVSADQIEILKPRLCLLLPTNTYGLVLDILEGRLKTTKDGK